MEGKASYKKNSLILGCPKHFQILQPHERDKVIFPVISFNFLEHPFRKSKLFEQNSFTFLRNITMKLA